MTHILTKEHRATNPFSSNICLRSSHQLLISWYEPARLSKEVNVMAAPGIVFEPASSFNIGLDNKYIERKTVDTRLCIFMTVVKN